MAADGTGLQRRVRFAGACRQSCSARPSWRPGAQRRKSCGWAVPTSSTFEAPGTLPASRLLPDAGYFVARADDGSHAVLDVGAHGYRNAGHAHADALSLTLPSMDARCSSIRARRRTRWMPRSVIGCAARPVTTPSRSTAGHSRCPRAHFTGARRWTRVSSAWRRNPSFDWIEAVARRLCSAPPSADVRPHASIRLADRRCHRARRRTTRRRRTLALRSRRGRCWTPRPPVRHPCRRQPRPGCSAPEARRSCFMATANADSDGARRFTGSSRPTLTARLAGEARRAVRTRDLDRRRTAFASPTLRWQPPDGTADPSLVVEIVDGSRTAVFMVRPSDTAGRACLAGEFETDARCCTTSEDNSRLTSLSIAGGRHCLATVRTGRPLPRTARSAICISTSARHG